MIECGDVGLKTGFPKIPVFAKKHALGKFDAKAFFEAWGTAFDVVFREESEFKVKNGPNY